MSGYIIGPCGVAPAAGGGGGGGTTFVIDNTGNGNFGSNTSFSFILPAVAANALCILSVSTSGQFPTGVSDGVGAYTAGPADNSGFNASRNSLWYAFRTASQSAGSTVTITTATATGMDAIFASFTGAAAATLDSGASFTQTGNATPAWTTSVAQTLAIGGIGPNNGNLTPATSGWNAISFASAFNTLVYKITSGTLSAETLGADGSGGYFSSALTAFK